MGKRAFLSSLTVSISHTFAESHEVKIKWELETPGKEEIEEKFIAEASNGS